MARPILKSVKRRRRTPSLESEIRAKARQIMDDQMADAMKAAALMIVARKLDEIRSLLRVSGFNQPELASGIQRVLSPTPRSGTDTQPSVENPCVQCGREGVRKTRRNKFNPTGSWFCAAHVKLAANSDFEDSLDGALLGNLSGPPVAKKPVVAPFPPVQMAIPPPLPMAQAQEAPSEGSASLEDAMGALGVN